MLAQPAGYEQSERMEEAMSRFGPTLWRDSATLASANPQRKEGSRRWSGCRGWWPEPGSVR